MTKTLIDKLKREAKALKKVTGCLHSETLDQVAKKHGFVAWSLLMKLYNKEAGK